MSILEKFRQWLDADYEEAEKGESRPRNKAEEFLVNVAREVENEMRAQMFTPPGGPTYIPRDYIVFLSQEDDAEWRGEKRRGLEQGLFHVLSEQAATIVGEQQKLQTSSFTIELRVDGTLEKGKFRIQAVWDTESDKTLVRPRSTKAIESRSESTEEQEDHDIETLVRPRMLFSVKITHGGEARSQNFSRPRVTIGRGSSKMKVDLPLEGDLEISRHHATIEYHSGAFKLTCEGRNPLMLDGVELGEGDTVDVNPGQKIEIGAYVLQIEEGKRG